MEIECWSLAALSFYLIYQYIVQYFILYMRLFTNKSFTPVLLRK